MKYPNMFGMMAALGGLAAMLTATEPRNKSGGEPGATVENQHILIELAGQTVKDHAGQELGKLDHLLLNSSGYVELGLVATGPDQWVPVPWQLMEPTGAASESGAQPTVSQLKVGPQELERAPTFARNEFQEIAQRDNLRRIYGFFGAVPRSNTAQGGVGSGQEIEQGADASTYPTPLIPPVPPHPRHFHPWTEPSEQKPDPSRPSELEDGSNTNSSAMPLPPAGSSEGKDRLKGKIKNKPKGENTLA